ncbi:MAG TPA: aminotransferase class V-fold PLP-dependent enzyme, partial [Gemmatimonadaceae bacterium]|nr:aminotransferase class V-fold PLP-dependent enzyme [Gemmatimonadaceae bacterium]
GSFSERFHKAAVNSGIAADTLEVPFGEYHAPDLLADTLKRKEYDVVTIVHSETSTGVLNPIRELAAVAHQAGDIAVVIDTVSSLAAGAVECDAWELDYVLTGSQKALALPPGLAFCTANERVFARARQSHRRGLYFDLLEFDEYYRKNQTPNTPAVSLLYALDLQLDHILAEGVEARWARHGEMAAYTWAWAESRGLRIFAPAGYRSPGVSCILMPAGVKGGEVAGAMRAKGFVVAPGYGARKDDMVRIGHMGEHTLGEVQEVLAALGEVLGR